MTADNSTTKIKSASTASKAMVMKTKKLLMANAHYLVDKTETTLLNANATMMKEFVTYATLEVISITTKTVNSYPTNATLKSQKTVMFVEKDFSSTIDLSALKNLNYVPKLTMMVNASNVMMDST